MALAPYHPIALSAVLRVSHRTARAATWASDRWAHVLSKSQSGSLDSEPGSGLGWGLDELARTTILSDPKDGGPLGVVDWTGPGVWTDAVLAYLRHRYGMGWAELRGLRMPMRVGEVVILPVTGFSPGVQQFGAGEIHGESREPRTC